MSRSNWASTTRLLATVLVLAFATAIAAPSAQAARSRPDHGRDARGAQSLAHARLLLPGTGYDEQRGSASVRALQRRLATAGCAPGPIDGRYGPWTEHAVACFQYLHNLTIDGVAGTITLAALMIPAPALHPGSGFDRLGGSPAVRRLQHRLEVLGFSPGPVDGLYGPLTTGAVARFQHARALRVDGLADMQTLRVLFRHPARAGSVPVAPHHAPLRPRRSGSTGSHHRSAVRRHSTRALHRPPRLPVGLILAGLAILGVALMAASYVETRSRARRAGAAGPGSTHHTGADVAEHERAPGAPRERAGAATGRPHDEDGRRES
jgi:peptidoglycan hydrolase-like protein with peptidoglycan-binding domain